MVYATTQFITVISKVWGEIWGKVKVRGEIGGRLEQDRGHDNNLERDHVQEREGAKSFHSPTF